MLTERGRDLDRAYALIRLAVDADPDNPAYLDSLGWVCFKRGELDQAELWLRRAVALDSGDGTLLAHLGEVLLARGAAEEATRLLQQALDIGCEDAGRVRSLLDGEGIPGEPSP
jgi:Flp pilus assembly protein TadD